MTIDPTVHQEIELRLARQDQRYTKLRRALVDTLAQVGRPLTINEIRAGIPDLSQSSAYRNITALIDVGAVRRVTGSDDHGRFELAEEHSSHHHHLVCGTCGKVEDVIPSPRLEQAMAEAARAVADEAEFHVTEHRVDLVGVCADCR